MISFGQLESRIRTLYEAESSVRWATDKILKSVNEGLDELAENTGFYESSVTIPLKGGQTYYDLRGFVPDDAVSINAVFNDIEQIWLSPWQVTDLRMQRWETVDGSPQRYLLRGAYWLGVYPRPGSDLGSVRVYYSGIPPHYSGPYSIVPDLTDDMVVALEDYGQYDLCTKDGETEKAMMHFASYEKREAELKAFVDNRITTVRHGRMAHRQPL